MGFTLQNHQTDVMETIKRGFAPEFRNRLDAIVQFQPLDATTILHVVDKFLTQLEVQLEGKRVVLTVSDAARAWLAERGYDPQMGARPMARVIQEHIKRPLADEILFGRLTEGGRVRVDAQDDRLALEIDSRVAAV
jgi:ATP-dependent Clp protease ATP-binding subunit ClpA